jgi:glycosyltransferase involved in cell wall biosynthesis
VRIVVDALQVSLAFSGVGRQVLEIGRELRDLPEGVEVELRCAADAAPVLAPGFAPGTRVSTPIASSRPRSRRILWQQAVLPRRESADSLLVSLGDQGPLWGHTRRLLVVNDVRRLTHPVRSAETLFYRTLVPLAARRAHAVATISQFSAHEIRRLLRIDAVVVAHHPAPRTDEPAPAGEHLLVVGALRAYKGTETVLDARPSRTVVFVGPTESPEDRRRADTLRSRGATVHGWVPDDELDRLYEDAYAVICPSTYEGYGLPVAEALARGQAVVASDIPSHREIGDDACLWFRAGDAASLADALAQLPLRRDDLARRAVARAAVLARERPTWRDVILDAATTPRGARRSRTASSS